MNVCCQQYLLPSKQLSHIRTEEPAACPPRGSRLPTRTQHPPGLISEPVSVVKRTKKHRGGRLCCGPRADRAREDGPAPGESCLSVTSDASSGARCPSGPPPLPGQWDCRDALGLWAPLNDYCPGMLEEGRTGRWAEPCSNTLQLTSLKVVSPVPCPPSPPLTHCVSLAPLFREAESG